MRRLMDTPADDDPLNHMRQRIEMCRRMARTTHNLEIAKALREMADEGERDLQKLLQEREERHARPSS